jgi:hypothetical protein
MTTNKQDLPQVVREVARNALERHAELQELDSDCAARFADAKWPEDLEIIKQHCIERYDHQGKTFLFTSVSSDATAINPAYAQYLEAAEEKTLEFLTIALQNCPPNVKADVISWINLKLSSRKLYWLAHATREHLESYPAPGIDVLSVAELQVRGNPSAAAVSANPEQPPPQTTPGQLAADMPSEEPGGQSRADLRRKKTDPTDEQVAAAERMVNGKPDVSIKDTTAYLRCSVQHVRRLVRQGKLIASNTVPKRITSESLKAYKWRSAK